MRDNRKCGNDDCFKKNRCGRFSQDPYVTYGDYAVGVDGQCDGYIIHPSRKAGVGRQRPASALAGKEHS
jgi:hypothetical protein